MGSISEAQENGSDTDDAGFVLVCEFRASLIAANKLAEPVVFKASNEAANADAVFVEREIKLTDRYPYTYKQVFEHLKAKDTSVKPNSLNDFIRNQKIKGNPKYSAYNYTSAAKEANGPTKSTPVIYSRAFRNFAEKKLCKRRGSAAAESSAIENSKAA